MKKIFALLLFFVFLVFLMGCVGENDTNASDVFNSDFENSEPNESDFEDTELNNSDFEDSGFNGTYFSLSITTCKETYYSREQAEVTVKIISPETTTNSVVRVHGIRPFSRNYIEEEKTVDLKKGENTIVFFVTMPFCTSGCGGVYPGPYDLHAVLENGEELAISKTIIKLKNN